MGFFARLFGRKKKEESAPAPQAAPAPKAAEPAPAVEPAAAPAAEPAPAVAEPAPVEKKRAAILAGTNLTVQADGQEHNAEGFRNNWVYVDNDAFCVSGLTAIASGTEPGTYLQTITGKAVVKDAKGNDVSDRFRVTVKPGILTITPGA